MRRVFTQIGLLAMLAAASACGSSNSSPSTASNEGSSNITTLQSVDVRVGTGTEATNGRTITVHYTGWLYSQTAANNRGTKFDSSVDRGTPFSFTLGAGRVIQGWDRGVLGMKVGGQRTLTIPPSLGYGSAGSPPVIPPNATLVFDVELLNVQ